jgi:hypothetical protein
VGLWELSVMDFRGDDNQRSGIGGTLGTSTFSIICDARSGITPGKRYDSIGSAPARELRAESKDPVRGTFDWGV